MKTVLNEAFQMSDLNKAQIIVDFQIIRDRNKWILTLNQVLYVTEILSEEKMRNCSAMKVLMKSEFFITLDKMNNVMKASFLTHFLFLDLLLYISLLNSSCYVIMSFHKKHITVDNVVYIKIYTFTHSKRFLCTIIM